MIDIPSIVIRNKDGEEECDARENIVLVNIYEHR